jgi:hypothetical protein
MPRQKHLPDPRTNAKRRKAFNPSDKIHISREQVIAHIDANHSGINSQLKLRALRLPERVKRLAKRDGLTKRQILQKQEQAVSRVVSEYVDHMISRMKEQDIFPHNISRHDEREAWINIYDTFLEKTFLTRQAKTVRKNEKKNFETLEIKDPKLLEERKAIVAEMDRTLYLALPPRYIIQRRKDRKKYGKKAYMLLRKNVNPKENLIKEVTRILNRRYSRPSRVYSRKQVIQAKAVQICLASSIYADLLERTKGENWTTAYSAGMMRIQYLTDRRPEIEAAIINLDKVETKD